MKWPQFLTFPRKSDFVVGDDTDPYLRRWWVIPRNKFFNIYLHEFCRSDDDRAMHDHSYYNLSLLLKGSYVEVLDGPDPHAKGRQRLRTEHRKTRYPGLPVARRPTTLHRVELVNGKHVWTLFITGPRIREWGFQCPKGWIPWQQFVTQRPGGNKEGPGCDQMKDYRTIIGSDFAIGDKVIIDDDTSLKGVVTAFLYRGDINNEVDSAEVSWIHNGASYTVWMQPWRLTKV